jgi:two-component system, OmpR family, sensor histidine kinase KdpD
MAGYRVVALLLLVTVSLLAMFLDIFPVMIAAVLSALTWDYFFIPPRFTFHISSTEDTLMLLMYFFIALINGVLTNKIRQIEKIARQKEEKEHAIRLYNTLLNSLSHELRTPIATIIGASDSLLQAGVKLTEDNKKELLHEISTASIRLNMQVDNLLNMSRLESGFLKPKIDWCDINELVYSITNKLQSDLKSHELLINVPDDLPLFKLDYGLMEQILFNLVNNAIQHTPTGSLIEVKAEEVNEQLVLTVSDTGTGFPGDEMEKVFDKFYRLQNAATGGTGLGLSIVKGLVQAQQGTIHLRNNEWGGAEFKIYFPVEASRLNVINND